MEPLRRRGAGRFPNREQTSLHPVADLNRQLIWVALPAQGREIRQKNLDIAQSLIPCHLAASPCPCGKAAPLSIMLQDLRPILASADPFPLSRFFSARFSFLDALDFNLFPFAVFQTIVLGFLMHSHRELTGPLLFHLKTSALANRPPNSYSFSFLSGLQLSSFFSLSFNFLACLFFCSPIDQSQ